MLTLALVFVAAVALGVDGQTPDYAAICSQHTMVKYTGVSPTCLMLDSPAITGLEIAAIVDAHNERRRFVASGQETLGKPGPQPPAANMRSLTWDPELAKVAQRWASQCINGHDTCRNVSRFAWVGQNAHKSKASSQKGPTPLVNAVASWYRESQKFNNANIEPFVYNYGTGHYTAVVWAETYLVGCGYAYFKSSDPADAANPFMTMTVCNYGPGGNSDGRSMYKIGQACSQCPAGTVCNSHLCV